MNPQLELANKFVEYTRKNLFLTGKAGTGKTTFLQYLKRNSPKRCVVVAPTGVAAINAGGVTIHSFFQMPFGPHLPQEAGAGSREVNPAGYTRISKTKRDIIRSLDLLIIDEVSMVRADLLDGIDEVLRRYRRTTKPFGGVQLLMIGDIRQLSPVVKQEERKLLQPWYKTLYFYGSRALQKTNFLSIELKQIFRQSDATFIEVLNKIRTNILDKQSLEQLNKRFIPGIQAKEREGYILLTTHNYKASDVNEYRINQLETRAYSWDAVINGDFPEFIYPTEYQLTLKQGAQVMFVKNDNSPEKQYFNGKIGRVEDIDPEAGLISVFCEDDHAYITVERVKWENCRYTLNKSTKEIEEEVIGEFIQYPLKLAWAITIHKSQGLTFDKAIIDAQDAFAPGQVYVALSRCRSMEGLVLSSPLSASGIKTDESVRAFSKAMDENEPDENVLRKAKYDFECELIYELFDFQNVRKNLLVFMKMVRENREGLLIDPIPVLQKMLDVLKTDIEDVTLKFNRQIDQLLSDKNDLDNPQLQDRIKKGAAYFSEILSKKIYPMLSRFEIESDNQQLNKQLRKLFNEMQQVLHIKMACLDGSLNGFELKNYLDVRAKAALDKTDTQKPSHKEDPPDLKDIAHTALFHTLRQWRNQQAEEKHLPAYRIFTQRALLGIANTLPESPTDLVRIKGIGKRTVEKYGKDILQLIREYCETHQITYTPDFNLMPATKKKNKPDSRRISYDMFRENKSISEIAAARGFAETTIEGHLAYFVEKGDLDVKHFLDEESLKEITEAIKKSDNYLLTSLKESLNHKYNFTDLKMAMAWYRSGTEKE